jgi:hypothetical protein
MAQSKSADLFEVPLNNLHAGGREGIFAGKPKITGAAHTRSLRTAAFADAFQQRFRL